MLLTLEQVAQLLALKSVQSVRNLAARGELRILRIEVAGQRGVSRIDSRDLDHYCRRLRARAKGPPTGAVHGVIASQKAMRIRDWATDLRRKPGATADEVTAADHCIEMFLSVMRLSEKIVQLRDDARRRRNRARSSYLRRAREVPSEHIPASLQAFHGKLIDYPVPTTGQPFIYFLLEGDVIVYVGSTVGLESRIAQHVELGKVFDRVLVMPVEESKRLEVEKLLIGRLCPPLNSACIPLCERLRRRRASVEAAAPQGGD